MLMFIYKYYVISIIQILYRLFQSLHESLTILSHHHELWWRKLLNKWMNHISNCLCLVMVLFRNSRMLLSVVRKTTHRKLRVILVPFRASGEEKNLIKTGHSGKYWVKKSLTPWFKNPVEAIWNCSSNTQCAALHDTRVTDMCPSQWRTCEQHQEPEPEQLRSFLPFFHPSHVRRSAADMIHVSTEQSGAKRAPLGVRQQ